MRILYSPSRTSLRSQCLKEVKKLALSYPDRRAILVVPEQTKMDIEKALTQLQDESVLMMVEVLSFRRLAWRLLGEIGQVLQDALSDIGKNMLIHRVLDNNRDRLHTFGHLADKPGFIRQVAAALGDVKRYCIDAGQLAQAAEQTADKALQNKTRDLSVLLEGYDNAMQQHGYGDAEDDLNRLGQVLSALPNPSQNPWTWPTNRLAWLSNCSVWISGFGELRDFTPQEDAIIEQLDRLCRQLTITVAAEHIPMDSLSVDHGADCLLHGRKTARRLLASFPDSQLEKLQSDHQGFRAGIANAIRAGMSCPRPDNPSDSGWLRLVTGDSVDDELDYVAGRIRQLVQQDGYRYQDIAVAACSMPAYSGPLRAAFRKFGIPLFLDIGRPLIGTPLARFVLSLLDIGLYNWPVSTVVSCLRCGLTPLDRDEIDRLENEMLARGINRYDRLMDDTRYTDGDLPGLRDKALKPVGDLLKNLAGTRKAADKCRLLVDFLVEYGVLAKIERLSADLAARADTEPAVTLVQAWNELIQVLEQMTSLAGDTRMSQKTFRDLLASGLDSAGSNVIPTAIDQVSAGELRRAMLRQPKILFIIGAKASELPPALPPEGLLGDHDRQTLSGLVGHQLPSSARDHVFSDAFVIYTLLTLPTDCLELTVPGEDVSAWFAWLGKAAPSSLMRLGPVQSAQDPRINALRPAFAALLGLGRQTHLPLAEQDQWLAVARVLADSGLPVDRGLTWLLETKSQAFDAGVRLPQDLIMALYNDRPVMSVSQLEAYASCPYLHWANYLLKLRERDVWQPEAAATGTLLHKVIELALGALREELAGLDPEDEQARQALLDSWLSRDLGGQVGVWLEKACEADRLRVFFERGIRASDGRRAGRLAESSLSAILRQYAQDDYRPAWLEWSFGPQKENQLTIQLEPGLTIDFTGLIDRVDQHRLGSGQGFRIIDYKSGDKKADYEALYHGLALQLPAYLEAFGQSNNNLIAEDAGYFQFSRPILNVSSGSRLTPDEIEAQLDKHFKLRSLDMTPDEILLLRRHTLDQIRRLAQALLSGEFDIVPRKLKNQPLACTYCDMKAVCGFDPASGHCRFLTAFGGKGKKQQLVDQIRRELGEGDDSHVRTDT